MRLKVPRYVFLRFQGFVFAFVRILIARFINHKYEIRPLIEWFFSFPERSYFVKRNGFSKTMYNSKLLIERQLKKKEYKKLKILK